MNTYVEQLVIELGRKCNLNCAHCLRGQSQNIGIDIKKAKEILLSTHVNSLTLTGGEPLLYKDKIINLIDFIISNKVSILNFYMATNGTMFDAGLMAKLAEFRFYVLSECNGYDIRNINREDDYNFQIDISSDEYHNDLSPLVEAMYAAYSFVHFKKEFGPNAWLINEGNAQMNGIGRRNLHSDADFIVDFQDYGATIEMVYLNSKGILLPECDWSYDTQDEYKEQFKTIDEVVEYYAKQFDEYYESQFNKVG